MSPIKAVETPSRQHRLSSKFRLIPPSGHTPKLTRLRIVLPIPAKHPVRASLSFQDILDPIDLALVCGMGETNPVVPVTWVFQAPNDWQEIRNPGVQLGSKQDNGQLAVTHRSTFGNFVAGRIGGMFPRVNRRGRRFPDFGLRGLSNLRALRTLSITVCLTLGMFGLATHVGATTTEAPPDELCANSDFACDLDGERANSLVDAPHQSEDGNSSEDCPDCESNGHCSTCPSSSAVHASSDVFSADSSRQWRSCHGPAPIEVPTNPPDRPPQT